MYKIEIYQTESGKEPFIDWKDSLDMATQAKIDARMTRIENSGNLGDCDSVGEGVFELRFHFGPGYRIYFGEMKKSQLLVLLGGTKGSQGRDIKRAKQYWQDHKTC